MIRKLTNYFKRKKLGKYLRDRNEANKHLNMGGCVSCWTTEQHEEYSSSPYYFYIVSRAYLSSPCPTWKIKEKKIDLDLIHIKKEEK